MGKMTDSDIRELKDMIQIGRISKVNKEHRTARVHIAEQGRVTGDLRILDRMPEVKATLKGAEPGAGIDITVEPWTPEPGDFVACLFLNGGDGDGVILGGI